MEETDEVFFHELVEKKWNGNLWCKIVDIIVRFQFSNATVWHWIILLML